MSFERAERRRALKAHAKAKSREEVRLHEAYVRDAKDAKWRPWSPPKKAPRGIRPGEPDTRDDKYLHSHARGMRGLVKALSARAA